MRTGKNKAEVTLQAAIGERFMPRLDVDAYCENPRIRSSVQTWVGEHYVGGFCIFGGTAQRVIEVISELQEIALRCNGTPLLFSADCEWGLPMRLRDSGTEFPDAMAIARANDLDLTFNIGRAIAEEMRALGILWNFAPVADVNSNPLNPIINTRAFSEDPIEAATQAAKMLEGIQSMNVAATAKHFPGHGDTMVDSHSGLPTISGNLAHFEKRELIPFKRAIADGVKSMMLGHIAVPELAKELGANETELDLPATLSRSVVQNLLRKRMGFEGVIVTDALEMKAITNRFGTGDAECLAAKAGVDILLMPADFEKSHSSLLRAAEIGELDSTEIMESYERIQELKAWVTLPKTLAGSEALNVLSSPAHIALAAQAAKGAIKVRGAIQQLRNLRKIFIVCDDRPATIQKAELFLRVLTENGLIVSGSVVVMDCAAEEFFPQDGTILGVFHRARGYLGGPNTVVTMPQVIRRIASKARDAGTVFGGLLLFGSPYLDLAFEDAQPGVVVKTYSESTASIEAAIKLLLRV